MTVAAVRETDAAGRPETVAAQLAALAAGQELLVVFGSNARSVQHALIADLRAHLHDREVTVMRIRHRHGALPQNAATVESLLDAGTVPVVVTPATTMPHIAAELASYLRADRVLRVLHTAAGADLFQVWQRPEPALN